jgi:hypothetical protein
MENKINPKLLNSVDTTLTKDEVEETAYNNQLRLNEYQKQHDIKTLTRRDFLNTGIITFTGSFMASNVLNMMTANKANAATVCQVSGTDDWVPLITVHLAGGACLASHFLPTDAGGQPLPTYDRLGWGKPTNFSVDSEFKNNAPFFGGSTFLAGIRANAAATTLGQTIFVGVPVQSPDDNARNETSISGLVAGMGARGKYTGGVGTANTSTGNGNAPAFLPPPAPLIISGLDSLTGALGVAGSLSPLVAAQRAGKMFEAIQSLSIHQAKRYVAQNGGSQLESTITCKSAENTNLIANPGNLAIDPRANAGVATVWGLAANTSTSSRNYQLATIAYNCIMANSGTGDINLGGYDSHDGTRTRGDMAENQAGVVVGQLLQTAAVLGKKVMIIVESDGSMASAQSDIPGAPWLNDNGVAGTSLMLAFDPTGGLTAVGAPQLGYMNASQGAASPLISSPQRAAAAMFVNWLMFNKKIEQIDKVLPRSLNPSEIDAMKKIA